MLSLLETDLNANYLLGQPEVFWLSADI